MLPGETKLDTSCRPENSLVVPTSVASKDQRSISVNVCDGDIERALSDGQDARVKGRSTLRTFSAFEKHLQDENDLLRAALERVEARVRELDQETARNNRENVELRQRYDIMRLEVQVAISSATKSVEAGRGFDHCLEKLAPGVVDTTELTLLDVQSLESLELRETFCETLRSEAEALELQRDNLLVLLELSPYAAD